MIDIDHFKQVNDTYGHGVGDQVLKAIAERLRAVRVSDLLARYGGEELVALCPETNAQEAERLAERLRLALRERDIDTTEADRDHRRASAWRCSRAVSKTSTP